MDHAGDIATSSVQMALGFNPNTACKKQKQKTTKNKKDQHATSLVQGTLAFI